MDDDQARELFEEVKEFVRNHGSAEAREFLEKMQKFDPKKASLLLPQQVT